MADNTVSGFTGSALVASNDYRDGQGVLDARDLVVSDNHIHFGTVKALRISGFKGLSMHGKRFVRNGQPVADPSDCAVFSDSEDVRSTKKRLREQPFFPLNSGAGRWPRS